MEPNVEYPTISVLCSLLSCAVHVLEANSNQRSTVDLVAAHNVINQLEVKDYLRRMSMCGLAPLPRFGSKIFEIEK